MFLGLCSTSFSFGCDEFSEELGPEPQVFSVHRCLAQVLAVAVAVNIK